MSTGPLPSHGRLPLLPLAACPPWAAATASRNTVFVWSNSFNLRQSRTRPNYHISMCGSDVAVAAASLPGERARGAGVQGGGRPGQARLRAGLSLLLVAVAALPGGSLGQRLPAASPHPLAPAPQGCSFWSHLEGLNLVPAPQPEAGHPLSLSFSRPPRDHFLPLAGKKTFPGSGRDERRDRGTGGTRRRVEGIPGRAVSQPAPCPGEGARMPDQGCL